MTSSSDASDFVIGRDLGSVGRLVRVLAGLLNLAAALSLLSFMRPVTATDLVQTGFAALVTAIVYTIAVAAVGRPLLARIDPWLAALLLVLPLAILFLLPFVPDWVTVGAFLFIAISQFVQAAIGYGGCEIAGIPTLVLRRRYTVYCALNGADYVEQWLRDRPRRVAWVLGLLAFVLTMALAAAAEMIGKAAGFFAAYLVFLLIGFVVNRIVVSRSQAAATVG
jgi:Family of unknown function (DUF6410)